MDDSPVTDLAEWLVLISEGGLLYTDSVDVVEQGLSCVPNVVILFVEINHRDIP